MAKIGFKNSFIFLYANRNNSSRTFYFSLENIFYHFPKRICGKRACRKGKGKSRLKNLYPENNALYDLVSSHCTHNSIKLFPVFLEIAVLSWYRSI